MASGQRFLLWKYSSASGCSAGAAWRDLSAEYGPWKTAYNRHRRWAIDGTWEKLLAELQRGSDADGETFDVGIDSTVIRAHQHSAGASHQAPKDVPVERLAVALDHFWSTGARSAKRPTGGSSESQQSCSHQFCARRPECPA